MRQTSTQIDQGILDVAAGIFAQYGYQHTSIQQIADAVGYSKAGLLHRFGTKEALFRAALDYGITLADGIIAEAETIPFGKQRNRAVLELTMEFAADHIGILRLALATVEPNADFPFLDEIQLLTLRCLALFDVPFETPRDRLRLVLALEVIARAVLAESANAPIDITLPRHELVPFAVDLALHVLERQ